VDKIVFKLMMTMKILAKETPDLMTSAMSNNLLFAGAAMSDSLPKCSWSWLQEAPWRNVAALVQDLEFFGDLKSSIDQSQAEWSEWFGAEGPESLPIPKLEERLNTHPAGPFMRLLLIRAFRNDRTRLAANDFIGKAIGNEYVEPLSNTMQNVWADSKHDLGVILMLTPGADPTTSLQDLAKKKGLKIFSCSMGEGQEPMAKRCIVQGMEQGNWALLQNCHLGLNFMRTLEDTILEIREEKEVNEDFRLWITCEPHPEFPVNLLQSSIKVTNEPPRGLRAGLFRSYTNTVDAQRLGRLDSQVWKDLVWVISFTHSVVQERRKFGPVGWCIPYEFNESDLEASLTFLETHCSSVRDTVSWPTIQYMICEVQYGGRITDDYDRRMFNAYGALWLIDKSNNPEFAASHGDFVYKIPEKEQPHEAYLKYIGDFPSHDSPEIFGLHTNADLTFGTFEAEYILATISNTQPKEAGSKGDELTPEQKVVIKADELEAKMPPDYDMDKVRREVQGRKASEMRVVLKLGPEIGNDEVKKIPGFSIPLNVFLFQEIECLDRVIRIVRATLRDLKLAIKGEIIMTPQLQEALDSVSTAKPPTHWFTDASGAEFAWTLPSLSLWFAGLLRRYEQLSAWLRSGRPPIFWLTGFFNPQGFLTAMRQEVTRRHKAEKWALDDVVLHSNVSKYLKQEKWMASVSGDTKTAKSNKVITQDGVYLEGLFLEGAKLDKEGILADSDPKELYVEFPIVHVTAVTSEESRRIARSGRFYECPVYTKKRRTDLNYVFMMRIKSSAAFHANFWVLRGVALLCSKE